MRELERKIFSNLRCRAGVRFLGFARNDNASATIALGVSTKFATDKLKAVPGIYVHIPFCARRCPYCDFAVTINSRADFRAAYVAALTRELQNELNARDCTFDTVFFGGGTPTELDVAALNGLLQTIRESGKLASDAEVALEANPENLDFDYLSELKNGGWNRLSLGAQSFSIQALEKFGRAHAPEKIDEVVAAARAAGFTNISLDLIYGEGFTSLPAWRETLRRALALDVEHLSCYSLTIESGTHFGTLAARGLLKVPTDDAQADLMEAATQMLGAAGLERYEVSNWAKPGFECRHNLNYWRGGDYLAAGCGAHGHWGGTRWWNVRDAKNYIARMNQSGSAREGEENLDARERLSEYIALGVRLREGFDLDELDVRLGLDARALLGDGLVFLSQAGALQQDGAKVRPAPDAMAIADGMALRLLREI